MIADLKPTEQEIQRVSEGLHAPVVCVETLAEAHRLKEAGDMWDVIVLSWADVKHMLYGIRPLSERFKNDEGA